MSIHIEGNIFLLSAAFVCLRVRPSADVGRVQGQPVASHSRSGQEVSFLAFHGLSHLGTRTTCHLTSAGVTWHGISSDSAAWCRDCQQCARGRLILSQQLHSSLLLFLREGSPTCKGTLWANISRGVLIHFYHGGQVH
jgi:hypothetical protein